MGLDPLTIGLIIAGTATAGSIIESRSARKQRKKAAQVATRRRDIESRRATIENIEGARQAIGTIQNVAAQTGGAGGSGAVGAIGSLTTQLGANVTFNQQLLQFAQRQETFLQKALDRQDNAQTFSAISSLALSAAAIKSKGK